MCIMQYYLRLVSRNRVARHRMHRSMVYVIFLLSLLLLRSSSIDSAAIMQSDREEPTSGSLTTDGITETLNDAIDQFMYEEVGSNSVCTVVANHLSGFRNGINLFDLFPGSRNTSFQIQLSRVNFDCNSTNLEFVSHSYGILTVIPEIMELGNTGLTLTANLSDVAKTLSVTFIGDWVIGDATVNVHVVYNRGSGDVQISASPSDAAFDIVGLANDLTGLSLPNPFGGELSFGVVLVMGMITSQGDLSVTISSIEESIKIFIIIDKPRNRSCSKALAMEVSNVQFATLVDQATGLDISSIPYFGSLTTPRVGLTISTAAIEGLPSGVFGSSAKLLSLNGDHIEEGITAYVNLSFSIEPIKLKYDEKLSFTPGSSGLSTSSLLSAIPNIDANFQFPFDVINVLAIDIDSFSLLDDNLQIDISYPSETLTVIPDIMVLRDVRLTLTINVTDIANTFVTFSGDWIIPGVTANVEVIYNRESGDVQIFASPSDGTFDLVRLANDLTGLSQPNPFNGDLTFNAILITGLITSQGDITLTISNTQESSKIFIIIDKPRNGFCRKALAMEFSNFQFATLVDQATGLDISGIPYFGSLTTPKIGLTIAQGTIEGLPSDIFGSCELLNRNGNRVEEGITAYIRFSFLMEPIKMKYNNETLSFFPGISGLSMNGLLMAIPNADFNIIPLPFDLMSILAVNINSFSLKNDGTVQISLSYPNELSFFDDVLAISDASITLRVDSITSVVRAEVAGMLSISSSTFEVSLTLDDNNKYVLRASGDTLPITDVIGGLQSEVLPSELNSLVSGLPFLHFSITNPSITYTFSSIPKKIHLGGQPVIAGYNTVNMDVLILRQAGRTIMVEGFEFGSINLADVLHTVSGFNFGGIALLQQNIDLSILISPVALPCCHLNGEKLRHVTIAKGVSFQGIMQFPDDCSADTFCAVAEFLIGSDTPMNLQGTYSSPSSFSLIAGLSDISVGSGLTISEAGIEIRAGTETSVGITGSIDLSNPDITLTCGIFLTTSGVKLEMTQSGCWENAFGADWLDICNILGSVTMLPGVPLTALEIGGEVRLGKCGVPIIAIGFIGIDTVTPTHNYYYVEFTGEVTISSLLDAFCVGISLPRPLADSGFPRGFFSSFSLVGKVLPHVPLSISPGYRLNGTLNILGLEGSADISINLPSSMDVRVALSPIVVGSGLLTVTASATDRSHGPYLRSSITILPSPMVTIEASCYVNVLGISVETTMRITDTEYEFCIVGRMLNLFQAKLAFSASYGNIMQAQFRVRGSLRSDLFDRIERNIKDVMKRSADGATAAIDAAQREVNRARAVFDSADRELRRAQQAVESANSAFDAAIRELDSARQAINSLCSIRSCSRYCVGCPDGFRCCARAWGTCVCYLPRWNGCCTRVSDPLCQTVNLACRTTRETVNAAFGTATAFVDTSRHTLDVVNLGLEAARVAVRAAESSICIAVEALEATQQVYRVATEAVTAISSFGLNGLINIHEVSFDAELGIVNGGKFEGTVRACFLGQSAVSVSLKINVHDITSVARQLAGHIGDGFTSLFD